MNRDRAVHTFDIPAASLEFGTTGKTFPEIHMFTVTPEYAHTVQAVSTAVRNWLNRFRQRQLPEQFYAFALWTHSDFDSPQPALNSLEQLQEKIRRDPDAASDEDLQLHYKWSPIEWAYGGDKVEDFSSLWGELTIFSVRDVDGMDLFDALLMVNALRLGATIQALKALGDEGFFGTGESRLAVYFSIDDDIHSGWTQRESAKRINPPEVFEKFDPEQCKAARYWYQDDANFAGDFAEAFYRMFGPAI